MASLEEQLNEEISLLQLNPDRALHPLLFEQAELLLPNTLDKPARLNLVHRLARLLKTLEQDPTPVNDLIVRLSEDFDYADILTFDHIPYIDALLPDESMVNYNHFIIEVLSKATKKPADAAHVASKLDIMLALVTLWLCTPDTGIASRAHRLLLNLLKIDREIPPGPDADVPTGGQGMVWKRIFGDRDIYRTIFAYCALSPPKGWEATSPFPGFGPRPLSRNQRTLAQSRLMAWLPAVGHMDWSAITRSHHPDVEAAFGVKESLLEFATLKMVDWREDVLMYRCLIDFYSELLDTFSPDPDSPVHDSPALQYLIAKGIHAKTAATYLDDYTDVRFVYGPAANYIAKYASRYPDHYLSSDMPKRVTSRLMLALDLSQNRWMTQDPPKHDLHVMASVPRETLLPGGDGNGWFNSSPLSLLPITLPVRDVLECLGMILHGPFLPEPEFPETVSPMPTFRDKRECSAARALYHHYISARPMLWRHITDQARVVAMTEAAVAAINVIMSTITANWATEPEFALPDDVPICNTGPQALINSHQASYAVQYLAEQPPSFSNLVGGRGDAESAAYKVAEAKYLALRLLHGRLVEAVERDPQHGAEIAELIVVFRNALQQGPFGSGPDVGGRIGTLDL